jgi:hypothetical protein
VSRYGAAERDPISVYRLLPGLGEFRTLLLDEVTHRRLIGWQRGMDAAPPTAAAQWNRDLDWRDTKFPSGLIAAPMLARDVVEQVKDDFAEGGEFLPVTVDGRDSGFDLYLVMTVANCLDTRRSSKPSRGRDLIKTAVFRPDAIPLDVPAFRVPESPIAVYWNGWAADLLQKLVGDDLERRLVWSEDKSLKPHPNPMWL